jgi:hypothetical protein
MVLRDSVGTLPNGWEGSTTIRDKMGEMGDSNDSNARRLVKLSDWLGSPNYQQVWFFL